MLTVQTPSDQLDFNVDSNIEYCETVRQTDLSNSVLQRRMLVSRLIVCIFWFSHLRVMSVRSARADALS